MLNANAARPLSPLPGLCVIQSGVCGAKNPGPRVRCQFEFHPPRLGASWHSCFVTLGLECCAAEKKLARFFAAAALNDTKKRPKKRLRDSSLRSRMTQRKNTMSTYTSEHFLCHF